MRQSVLNIIMLTLGGVLGATLSHLNTSRQASITDSTRAASEVAVPGTNIDVAETVNRRKAFAPFQWSSLESTNYATYVSNLRAVGCPEETIRDIILAELDKMYSARLAALRAPKGYFKFWEKPKMPGPDALRWSTEYKRVQEEKRGLMKELVGVDIGQDDLKSQGGYYGQSLKLDGFLPPEKFDKTFDVFTKFEQMRMKVIADAPTGFSQDDRERLMEIETQRHKELAAFLNPDELAEFEMRNTGTGDLLRQKLASFNPTPEEFRAIYDLQSKYHNANLEVDFNEINDSEFQNKIKAVLSNDRYEEYRRSYDAAYSDLINLGISQDDSKQIYELKRKLEEKVRDLSAAHLPDSDFESGSAALRESAESYIRGVLGPDNASRYLSSGGQWVKQIGRR